MKMTSLTALAVVAARVLPLSAQSPAPAASSPAATLAPAPATELKKADPAKSVIKLADIDPPVRAYLLETAASLLDAGATSMDAYATTGKTREDLQAQDLIPALLEALKKPPTAALPDGVKPFMDELVVITTQAGTDLSKLSKDAKLREIATLLHAKK